MMVFLMSLGDVLRLVPMVGMVAVGVPDTVSSATRPQSPELPRRVVGVGDSASLGGRVVKVGTLPNGVRYSVRIVRPDSGGRLVRVRVSF